MAALTTKRRKSLKKSQFALPATKQYPIDTPARAANAKARAAQQLKAGNLSRSKFDTIVAKANKILKRKRK